MVRRLFAWLFAGLMLIGVTVTGKPAEAADFDFYVLSLSWSPSWCAENDRSGRTAQCNGRRNYGFIVHGLWPQSERGWLQDCASNEPGRVPDSLVRGYYDIIPSAGLMGHEWRKHGTCSGLNQQRYFATLRAAFARIKLPPVIFNGAIDRRLSTDDIEKLMMTANPGLSKDGIAITCDNGELAEVRICLSQSLGFRSCGQIDRNACRQRIVSIPAIP